MKTYLKSSTSALVLASFLAAPAFGADVYNGHRGESVKDAPEFFEHPTSTRSGLYISGNLGIAQGDRTLSGEVTGTRYDYEDVVEGEGESPDTYVYGDPTVSHFLPFGTTDDVDSTVFGGEVSYLFQLPNRRFGLEIGLGGTGYTDNKTSVAFDGRPTDFVPGEEGEWPSIDTVAGSASFERDFDIDLVAKAHFFAADRLSLYAGGGLSWARASLKGGHDNSNDPAGTYDNAYDDSESAFGYVLVAGAQYWVADNVVLGLEYNYKVHEFDFNSSSSTEIDGVLRNTADDVTVEDELHTIKAKLGIKLN